MEPLLTAEMAVLLSGKRTRLGVGEVLHGVGLLERALHDAEALAGEPVGVGDARGLGGDDGQVAGEVAVGEVDGLLALVGDADGRDADVELAVGDGGEQTGEVLPVKTTLSTPVRWATSLKSSTSKPVKLPFASAKV